MIISFKLSLLVSFVDIGRRRQNVATISSPEKHIILPPVSPCSLSSLSLSVLLRIIYWNSCSEEQDKPPPPPSFPPALPSLPLPPFSHCPAQKRKQLKGNLLDCLCLYHLREGSRAVMIITQCWIITQNLRFTRAYLSV